MCKDSGEWQWDKVLMMAGMVGRFNTDRFPVETRAGTDRHRSTERVLPKLRTGADIHRVTQMNSETQRYGVGLITY